MHKISATIAAASLERRNSVHLIEKMEEDLLSGHFRPGEWLKQTDVEQRYDAHRFDVRMALKDLNARRMLEHLPNRGYRVAALSDKERADLLEARAILERAAMYRVVMNATPKDIQDLNEIIAAFASNMGSGDLAFLRQINVAFHDRFYAICGNSVLEEEIQSLRRRGQNGFRGGWQTVDSISRSHEHHVEMVRLLSNKDGKGLARLVDQHLNLHQQVGAE